jgi:hypothetical protein
MWRRERSMAIHRRQVLICTASAVLTAMVGSPAARGAMREQTQTISATALPAGEPTQPFAFDLFYDLSRYLTARPQLDRDLAQEFFAEFRQEEWGWANAGRLYGIIRQELDAGVGSAPELLSSGRLSDLDQWFAQHILDAWYEGIYRYDGAERRVTYERALMWDPVRDLVPVQGLSDADYGYWGSRPAKGDLE